MASGFYKNGHRYDPYKNFKFLLYMGVETTPVLGISKVSALKRTTEVVKYRSGGDNSHDHKSPGRSSFEPITMERGLTQSKDFEAWARRIHDYNGDSLMDLVGFKRNLRLELLNEKGQVALRYLLYNCWVSEYTAMPDLDANANAVAIESLKIELEGWEHDPEQNEEAEG